ncbi:hypothetical protein BH20ACT8_BH20ACT8_09290 [soil metagenome]
MSVVDPSDETLTAELRAVAGRLDPPPPQLRDAARMAFGWRSVDNELAELVSDSAIDHPALSGVRAGTGPRLLTFMAPQVEVEIELQVSDMPSGRLLVGQVVPPQEARIEVRRGDAVVAGDADPLGRFAIDGLSPGAVSLRCTLGTEADPRVVDTEWLFI